MTIEELKEVFTSDFKVKRIKHVFKAQPFNKPEEQVYLCDYEVAIENHLDGEIVEIYYSDGYGACIVKFKDDDTVCEDRIIIGTPDTSYKNVIISSFTGEHVLEDYHVYEAIAKKGKEKRLYFIKMYCVKNAKKACKEVEKYIDEFITKDGNSLVVIFDITNQICEQLEKRGWRDRTFNPEYNVCVKRF